MINVNGLSITLKSYYDFRKVNTNWVLLRILNDANILPKFHPTKYGNNVYYKPKLKCYYRLVVLTERSLRMSSFQISTY